MSFHLFIYLFIYLFDIYSIPRHSILFHLFYFKIWFSCVRFLIAIYNSVHCLNAIIRYVAPVLLVRDLLIIVVQRLQLNDHIPPRNLKQTTLDSCKISMLDVRFIRRPRVLTVAPYNVEVILSRLSFIKTTLAYRSLRSVTVVCSLHVEILV